MRIFKYSLGYCGIVGDSCLVTMPKGARILSVQVQDGSICVWALVDPGAEMMDRSLYIVGTGQPLVRSDDIYLGTVQMPPFVWHLFEENV